eukprot:5394981-Pleurochrysis_carterae.AAC.1
MLAFAPPLTSYVPPHRPLTRCSLPRARAQTLVAAMESLFALGALDEEGLLTRLGRRMAEFPLEPPMSKILIQSVDLGCSEEVLTLVAMLSVRAYWGARPRARERVDGTEGRGGGEARRGREKGCASAREGGRRRARLSRRAAQGLPRACKRSPRSLRSRVM